MMKAISAANVPVLDDEGNAADADHDERHHQVTPTNSGPPRLSKEVSLS